MSLQAASSRAPAVDLGVLPSELDGGVASRAAIGLLVLATDQTMEHEFRRLVRQPGVAFYEARVFNDFDINPETLRAIGAEDRAEPGADLAELPLDVVAFGCTSATMTLGEAAVFAEIHKVRPNVACTTPVTAALAAFTALGARRIGLLTPYTPEINASFVKYFGERGLNIAAVATFDRRDDREAARISVASIEDAAAAPCGDVRGRCDFYFLHEPKGRGGRRAPRGTHRRAHHLQQPCDGLALSAARGHRRCRRRRGEAVRTARPLRRGGGIIEPLQTL